MIHMKNTETYFFPILKIISRRQRGEGYSGESNIS